MRSEVKPYEAYKTVNAVWIDKIPLHWSCEKLGMYFEERRIKVSDKDYEPLSVTKNGVVPQLATAAKSNDGDNRKLVVAGDFVVNSRSDRKGSSGLSKLDGSVSLINIVLQPRNILPQYSHYLFKSNGFTEEFYRNGRGIVADLWTTRYCDMRNIFIPIPTPKEQEQIVKYLECNLNKINKLIRAKNNQIVLLKEQKQQIINEAVTRGVNDTVEMVPSQMECLGDIPRGWKILKFRHIFKYTSGLSITKSERVEAGVSCINYGEIHSKFPFILDSKNVDFFKIDEIYLNANSNRIIKDGDFIFADTSEDLAGCGNFIYIQKVDEPILSGSHTVLARPFENIDVKGEFLAYLLKSDKTRHQIKNLVNGVKVYSISQKILKSIVVAIPSLEEQQDIVDYIGEKISKIDNAIKKIEDEINLISEYKLSLISEVVTGKVNVSSSLVSYIGDKEEEVLREEVEEDE
nr:restriction endonuclease subunit S [uncultured Niameybacter sp.]